jgi:hypothetical protein
MVQTFVQGSGPVHIQKPMHPEDTSGFRVVGHSNLDGHGDGMQVMPLGDVLYVAHFGPSGKGTTILDISDRTDPRVVRQWDAPIGSHTHKVQVADGLLMVNHELFRSEGPAPVGMAVYDLDDPFDPRRVGFFDTGGRGVHRIVFEGGDLAYISATPDGYTGRIWMIVDVSEPTRPSEVGRWWWPGMWRAGGEILESPANEEWLVHHAMVHGDRAYLGFWDGGMVVIDISDPTAPRTVSRLGWDEGGHTHTCLPVPDRNLVVVTDEAITEGCDGDRHMVRIVDISDERAPFVRSICPVPEGDFCERGLRFGAHCLHENRPNSYRSQELIFATYFNAGLRVYDISDPDEPAEVAHWIPECPPNQAAAQINDVYVSDDLTVYATDRVNGGVYLLEPDHALTDRMTQAAR